MREVPEQLRRSKAVEGETSGKQDETSGRIGAKLPKNFRSTPAEYETMPRSDSGGHIYNKNINNGLNNSYSLSGTCISDEQ